MNAEEIRIESDERGFELHIDTTDGDCCHWQAIAELLAATMRGHPGFVHRQDAERVALVAFDDAKTRGDGRYVFNIHGCAEQLWDECVKHIGPWLLEAQAAKREFDSGRADDPTQQAVLDEIKDDYGPWPGESVMDYYRRTGQDGPLREVADAMNKARRENA